METDGKQNNMITITAPYFIELTGYATRKPLLINLSHVIEITKDITAQGAEVGDLILVDNHRFNVCETYDEIMQMLRHHERREAAKWHN